MGQHPAGCCGSKCGQPTIVSIGDDVCPPKLPGPEEDPGLGATDALPEWISDLAPTLIGEEAERAADAWVRCGEDMRRRTRQFVRRAMCGIPCWFIDQKNGRTVPASYMMDEALETLIVETANHSEVHHDRFGQEPKSRHIACECQVSEIRNVWVCADNELARRIHGTLRHGCDADMACVMLVDAPTGPIGLVERTSEAREDFLDCMAVLIAAQRLRNEPEVACCRRAEGPPPPEARLRPFGKSLQSAHVSGPICAWLAQAAEDLLPHRNSERHSNGKGPMGIDAFAPEAANIVHEVVPACGYGAGGKPREVLLVDIDAPTPEGLRGPVPLLTPQWISAGVTAGRAWSNAKNVSDTQTSLQQRQSADQSAVGSATRKLASHSDPPRVAKGNGLLAERVPCELPVPREIAGRSGKTKKDAARRGSAPPGAGAVNGHDMSIPDSHGTTFTGSLPGPLGWDPGVQSPQPVREPPASVDGMPMMMGGWAGADHEPMHLYRPAANNVALPPETGAEYPNLNIT